MIMKNIKYDKMNNKIDNTDYGSAYKYLRKLHKLYPEDNRVKFELAKVLFYHYDDKMYLAKKYFQEIYNFNKYPKAKLFLARIHISSLWYRLRTRHLHFQSFGSMRILDGVPMELV